MELLRKAAMFGASIPDMKTIYLVFVRQCLEQSAVVWHSSITQEQSNDLERCQKNALRIFFGYSYLNYKNALQKVNLATLKERRNVLCLKFAKQCLENPCMTEYFQLNEKDHAMKTRNCEVFKVFPAHTERLNRSPILYLQKILNENAKKDRRRDPT